MTDEVTVGDDTTKVPLQPNEGEEVTPPKETVTEEQEDQDTDTPEIPVRSRAQYIIKRQQETIKRLRSKTEDDVDTDEDTSSDVPPTGNAVTREDLESTVAPLQEALVTKADEDDLRDLFDREPDAKKYSRRIRAFMKDPHYENVAPDVIFHHLAFEKSQQIGAKRKQTADLEAAQSQGAGSSIRPDDVGNEAYNAEDISNMSPKELQELQHKVMSGTL